MVFLGPKVRYGKPVVKIGAEVIHDSDGEEDVHPKLEYVRKLNIHIELKPTLKTSRLGPAIVADCCGGSSKCAGVELLKRNLGPQLRDLISR